jgi:hypothetical protein
MEAPFAETYSVAVLVTAAPPDVIVPNGAMAVFVTHEFVPVAGVEKAGDVTNNPVTLSPAVAVTEVLVPPIAALKLTPLLPANWKVDAVTALNPVAFWLNQFEPVALETNPPFVVRMPLTVVDPLLVTLNSEVVLL